MDSFLSSVNLALFIPAVFALIVTPGPVVMYIVTRSISQGRRVGLISVVGSELGNFCHVIAAAFGLTAILASSALLFDLVKYLGAAYLIYLGIRKLRTPSTMIVDETAQQDTLLHIFLQGIVVAVLNPKTALFFFSFFPLFIDPTQGNVTVQILFLGTIMVVMATITDSLWALATGTAGRWLRGNQGFLRAEKYVSGTMYIGLGIAAALSSSSKK